MNTPLQPPNSMKGWVMLGVSVLITIAGSTASISEMVNGYLNKRLVEVADTMTMNMAAVMQGQFLIMQDSITARFDLEHDSMDARFTVIEEQIGLRPVSRITYTTTPPDTAALRSLQQRMHTIEAQQLQVLDGLDALLTSDAEQRKEKTWPKKR